MDGSFCPLLDTESGSHYFCFVWNYGRIEIPFQHICAGPPFDTAGSRRELLDRLNAVPGVSFSEDIFVRRPGLPTGAFGDEAVLVQLPAVFNWMIERYQPA